MLQELLSCFGELGNNRRAFSKAICSETRFVQCRFENIGPSSLIVLGRTVNFVPLKVCWKNQYAMGRRSGECPLAHYGTPTL